MPRNSEVILLAASELNHKTQATKTAVEMPITLGFMLTPEFILMVSLIIAPFAEI